MAVNFFLPLVNNFTSCDSAEKAARTCRVDTYNILCVESGFKCLFGDNISCPMAFRKWLYRVLNK